MSPTTRLLLIDAQPVVLAGCRTILDSIAGDSLMHARSARSGFEQYSRLKPDISILDLNLPDEPGLQLARRILAADPTAKLIVFTTNDAPVLALQAVDIGVTGFVSKYDEAPSLREAVVAVLNGRQWISETLIQEMALIRAERDSSMLNLNEKETAVLRALVGGFSLAEIATQLDLSYKTVAAYCVSLRKKLKARTTSELVRIAIQLHIA